MIKITAVIIDDNEGHGLCNSLNDDVGGMKILSYYCHPLLVEMNDVKVADLSHVLWYDNQHGSLSLIEVIFIVSGCSSQEMKYC